MAKPWERYGSAQPGAPAGIPIGLQDPAMDTRRPAAVAGIEQSRASAARTNQQIAQEAVKFPFQQREAAANAGAAEAKMASEQARAQQAERAAMLARLTQGMSQDEVLSAVQRAKGLTNGWSTGIAGQALGGWGGTDAHDLQSQLATIGAGTTLDKLQALRDTSATGASGLGQLSNQEGRMLRDSVASLDPTQREDLFRQGLSAVEDHYKKIKNLNVASTVFVDEMARQREKFIREYRGRGDPAKIWESVAVPTGRASLQNRMSHPGSPIRNAPRKPVGGAKFLGFED